MSATILMQIGGDLWNARLYASLSAASELAAEFDQPKNEASSNIDAQKACQLLNQLNGFLSRGLSAADNPLSVPPGTPKEKLIAARDSMVSLYGICERLLALSSEIGQLGEMKSELELLRAQSERLLDLADWLDALSTPEEIDAIFKAAEHAKTNGDFVPWSEVR